MTIPATRQLNLAGFLACLGMMAFALYAENYMLLTPCPLCVFQRMAVIALGTIFLVATLHNPSGWGRRVYAVLMLLAAGGGIGVASRHVWLQSLPPDQVPACGAGYDYIMETLPLGDALRAIFTGSGECAEIDWTLLGLSMPAWVLISLVFVGGAGLWINLRSPRKFSGSIG
jgi:disulfide bond formation protein DsbB